MYGKTGESPVQCRYRNESFLSRVSITLILLRDIAKSFLLPGNQCYRSFII